jgi:hypothetical protein
VEFVKVSVLSLTRGTVAGGKDESGLLGLLPEPQPLASRAPAKPRRVT